MNPTDTLKYRIAFSALKGINVSIGQRLLGLIGDEQRFFEASPQQLASLMGSRHKMFDDSVRQEALEAGEKEAAYIKSHNVRAIYFTDADYPYRLAQCADAPLMLYGTGPCNLNERHIVGIVGTRHATAYGATFIAQLLSDLSQKVAGLITVSGLAYGIDVMTHKESLNFRIPTVGVVAHGLSTLYPAVHRNVAVEMVQSGGMILTEYRHDNPVHKGNFLARNRIIAGLCDALIVVESAVKGGAMLTARLASDYDRGVFALPGRYTDRYSSGCNQLIRNHYADVITGADDLIDMMGWTTVTPTDQQASLPLFTPTPEQSEIIDFLSQCDHATVNMITSSLNRPVAEVMAVLVDLEFNGLLKSLPGSRYKLIR